MNIFLIFVLVFFWTISVAYATYYFNKQYTVGLDIILVAILLGPIFALLVKKDYNCYKRYDGVQDDNNKRMDDTHRRWFQPNDMIRGESVNQRGFHTIPPISRVERARTERDEAIRLATERIDKKIIKDFKFFQK